MSFRTLTVGTAFLAFGLVACADDTTSPMASSVEVEQASAVLSSASAAAGIGLTEGLSVDLRGASTPEEAITAINENLAARDAGIALQKIEWVTNAGGDEAGQTVFATDRELRLDSRWVPGDARRGAMGEQFTHPATTDTGAFCSNFSSWPRR